MGTLVTAGVYLLIRINLIIIEINISKFLRILGMLTIIIAGITAIVEIDIKKVTALSTLRQLGIIIIILGMGNPVLSFFHLISHAFFKDIIIEIVIIKGKRFFLFFLLIIGTRLTVIYSCRLNFLISLNFIKVESFYNIRENSNLIIVGIMFLLPLSIIGGLE